MDASIRYHQLDNSQEEEIANLEAKWPGISLIRPFLSIDDLDIMMTSRIREVHRKVQLVQDAHTWTRLKLDDALTSIAAGTYDELDAPRVAGKKVEEFFKNYDKNVAQVLETSEGVLERGDPLSLKQKAELREWKKFKDPKYKELIKRQYDRLKR